jgi:hypothetical protein
MVGIGLGRMFAHFTFCTTLRNQLLHLAGGAQAYLSFFYHNIDRQLIVLVLAETLKIAGERTSEDHPLVSGYDGYDMMLQE